MSKPKIGWIADHDTLSHPGGAQQTNKIMIDWGKKNGWDIHEAGKDTVSLEFVKHYDVLIVNNLHEITANNPKITEFIIAHGNYIRYEHDYFESKYSEDLFARSMGNIFLSPLHLKSCMAKISTIKKEGSFLQPSPIDTKLFKVNSKIDRKPNMVFWAGDIREHKGIVEVIALAKSQPGREFVFATIPGDNRWVEELNKLSNCGVIGLIDHKRIPDYFNRAQYFIHLPKWKEPFGRTIMEAYLSGCDLIVNDNIGALSYKWDWSNYNAVKEKVEPDNCCKRFWKTIGRIIG